ncbi:MAG: single-stranded-DNA-specific exonuclease RecJ [Pseudomonadota bacterium]
MGHLLPKDVAEAAFLGVASSLLGRRWVGLDAGLIRQGAAIAQVAELPELAGRVLAARGVPADSAAVRAFLAPTLRALMPDPSVLRDMERAASRLVAATLAGERIAIFADYDVDGAASAALLLDWLAALGQSATLYVPDRVAEGYGPNFPAMQRLAEAHDLIVCVDCGTLAHEAIGAAAGAEVLVLDHHQGGETLPPALAVVNPNRQDERAGAELRALAAAGVVFLVLVAANRLLRAEGREGPDLLPFLDLVALATVADVAPLTGLNRAFVRQGLVVMARRARPGLAALADVASLTSAPTAYHLGYLLGPRLNAGGRVGGSDLGTRLLVTRDGAEAARLAAELDALNQERRSLEASVLAAAMAAAEARGTDGPLVWAAGEGWHPGVVGIVAARLKEWANRPAVVIALDGETGQGSARSVIGIDLGAAVAETVRDGLLMKGGGHAMAAGLSVRADGVEAAMERLAAALARQGADRLGPPDLCLDAVLAPRAATVELVEVLERAGPFGAGAPGPRVAVSGVLSHVRRLGERHIAVTLSADGGRLDAVAFGAFDGPLGPALEARQGMPVHLAGRLERDDWRGRRRARLRIEDAADPT